MENEKVSPLLVDVQKQATPLSHSVGTAPRDSFFSVDLLLYICFETASTKAARPKCDRFKVYKL